MLTRLLRPGGGGQRRGRIAAWTVLGTSLIVAGLALAGWATEPEATPTALGVVTDRAAVRPTTTPPGTSPAVSLPRGAPELLGSHSARLEDLPRRTSSTPVSVAVDDQSGIAGPVVPAGIDAAGAMAVGTDPALVAWYEHGPSPGESGSSVLAGHVDYGGRTGVFFRLTEVRPGAEVVVTFADRSERRFVVVARRQYAKSDLPTEQIFARDGDPQLVLITCGGEFDDAARSYRENVVVYAEPVAA